MKKYEVLKEFDEKKVGDIIELPDDVNVEQHLTDGVLKLVEEVPLPKEGDVCEVDGKSGTLKPLGENGALVCHVEPDALEAKAGDVCTTDVGEAGTLQEVEGALICVANKKADEENTNTATGDVAPKLYFTGKLVVADTTREVNGKSYHHFRLEDGAEMDVTDEEYAAVLEASKAR